MRKILSMIAVLMAAGVVLAADGTQVPATAKVPAVATAPTMITWYGMAMLRLREEIETNTKTGGSMEEKAVFSHQLGYKIGAKVKPNDIVLLQFELGNDWSGTDLVQGIPGNYLTRRDPNTPWFSLAFVQWDPGYMHIAAGIIPVKGSGLMDLLANSIINTVSGVKGYSSSAFNQWGVITNFSQTGLRIGAPVLTGDFKLGVDIMSAIIEHRTVNYGIDTMRLNGSAMEFLVEAPLSCCSFTAVPQVFIIPNRSFDTSARSEKGDMEIGAGVDAGYKLNDGVTFRASVGYAQNSNTNSYKADSIYKDPFDKTKGKMLAKQFENSGTIITIGSSVKMGPGKFDVDVNYSMDKNAKDLNNVDDSYLFVDMKYGWLLNKNFIVMPRLRFFYSTFKNVYDSKLRIRPEIILNGTF